MKLNAEVVKKALKEKGMTQIELCRQTGIDDYALSKYLHGVHNIPRDKMIRIADCLGLDIFEIMKYDRFNY